VVKSADMGVCGGLKGLPVEGQVDAMSVARAF
jgi:hypothetical protein